LTNNNFIVTNQLFLLTSIRDLYINGFNNRNDMYHRYKVKK